MVREMVRGEGPRGRGTRALAAATLVVAVLSGGLGAAAEAPPPDWLLLKVTAPADRSVLASASLSYVGRQRPGDAVLNGAAFPDGRVSVSPMAPGDVMVSTTAAGGTRVRVLEVPVPVVFSGQVFIRDLRLEPGQAAAILVFHPGAALEVTRPPEVSAHHGIELVSGHGSLAVELAAPTNTGTAASAGVVAAGQVTHRRAVEQGIVGAFLSDVCLACTIGWSGPHDSVEDVVLAAPLDRSEPRVAFRGPAGGWSWEWSGVAAPRAFGLLPASVPQFVAWAPVGEDWRLFVPDHGTRAP